MKCHVVWKRLCVVIAVLLPVVTATGCLRNLLLWPILLVSGGPKVDAEYDGLEDQRVAVVCISSLSTYGPDSTTDVLAREIQSILAKRVDDIKFVDRQAIHKWTDTHEWNQDDYRKLGREVGADMVLAIELTSYSLHAGQTLYQGKADINVSVFDMTNRGKKVYQQDISDYRFPAHSPTPTIGLPQPQFERMFIQTLAREIGNLFHDYELPTRFARDGTF
ncbi:MAG: hypothetical protein IH987_13380 [Planctomycetes bacterium]|nr:hypothetical protein [Planctomycetota bacterium]